MAYLIASSTEYRADEIESAFQTLLHRAADAPSLTYFLNIMSQGASLQQIDALIAGSDEYYQNRASESDPQFLAAVYQDFLHRNLDPSGLQQWQQALTSGQSRTQVVMDILSTAEYQSDLVQNDYQTYLNRNADPTSLNSFVTYLTQGGSNDAVVAALLGSQEYLNNALASSTASTT